MGNISSVKIKLKMHLTQQTMEMKLPTHSSEKSGGEEMHVREKVFG